MLKQLPIVPKPFFFVFDCVQHQRLIQIVECKNEDKILSNIFSEEIHDSLEDVLLELCDPVDRALHDKENAMDLVDLFIFDHFLKLKNSPVVLFDSMSITKTWSINYSVYFSLILAFVLDEVG